ncbi:hypothetical protein DFQ26_003105 [Actinomortierella ambigua]|nr:hypothetical protein DFQ26_003105 [Actinomortierella ambigua]
MFFLSQSEAAQQDIKREIAIMRKLRHPHIVLFHREAIILERLTFIMEYADKGSLQRIIRYRIPLDWPLKEKITQGIVRGLAYIHSEGVIHRDLKSGNVLLTKHMEPKLCDFGLASVKDFSITKAGEETLKGSVRWMAPELFIRTPRYNTKTDIYALGWIMWELAAERTPPFWEQPADAVVIGLVKGGERLPIPNDIPHEYQQWIQRCWNQTPSSRPRASEMVVEDPEPEETNDGEVSLGTISASRVSMMQSESESQKISIPSSSKSSVPSSITVIPANAKVTGDAAPSVLTAAFQDVELKEIDDYHGRAEKGDRDALFALAEMHKTSTGTVKDDLEALVCFFEAAKKGHAEAQFRIAQMYQAGQSIPIPRDVDRAKRWLEQAVDHGHAQAKENLDAMLSLEQAAVLPSRSLYSHNPYTSQAVPTSHLPASHSAHALDSTSLKVAQTSAPQLVMGSRIGSGNYAAVYRGRWGARQVAIKRFFVRPRDVNLIRREVEILERLRHRNIIQFYGATYYHGNPDDDGDDLVLAMDLAEESLRSAIEARRLDWPTKARITQEIVRGLAYIHEEGILHCDLKSSNVLLTRHLEVKLTDFGQSAVRLMASSQSSWCGSPIVTIRWAAPELFLARPEYTIKSDMYALGMVMWEMAADRTTPFRGVDEDVVVRLVSIGQREEIPADTPAKYREWIERYWDEDPPSRPEAADMISYDDYGMDHAKELLIGPDDFPVSDLSLEENGLDLSDSNAEPTAASPPIARPLDTTQHSSSTPSPSQVEGSAKNRIRRAGRWLRSKFR